MPFVLADSLKLGSVASERCARSNGQVNSRCIETTLMKEDNMLALTPQGNELHKVVLKTALYALNDDVGWAVAINCLNGALDLIFAHYEEIFAELLSINPARTSAECEKCTLR